MAKFEKLTTIIEYPERYGGMDKIKIKIPLDFRKVTLESDMAGTKANQTFETEMNHTWVPFQFKGKLYLASRELSNKHLRLNGKKGYMSNGRCQKEIAELYANEKMGIKGVPFVKEMFESLPTFLRESLDKCWTADIALKCSELGYWSILNGRLSKISLVSPKWSKGHVEYKGFNMNMLFVVEIPDNAIINVDVPEGKASRLYTSEPYFVTEEQMQELTLLAKENGQKSILKLITEIVEDQ
ncbi:MAG: hypothetical protein HFJ50_03670 [Clostridia bacterium]|nr:hypothetical protein [Clostridia bacterium]